MGKRARQQKRRAQKRKKRRVAFAEAAATKVIPASDPARASGPDRMALRAAEVAVAACFRWVDGSGFKLEGWLVIRARASRVSLASEVRLRR